MPLLFSEVSEIWTLWKHSSYLESFFHLWQSYSICWALGYQGPAAVTRWSTMHQLTKKSQRLFAFSLVSHLSVWLLVLQTWVQAQIQTGRLVMQNEAESTEQLRGTVGRMQVTDLRVGQKQGCTDVREGDTGWRRQDHQMTGRLL